MSEISLDSRIRHGLEAHIPLIGSGAREVFFQLFRRLVEKTVRRILLYSGV